jgi:hypothetical protein
MVGQGAAQAAGTIGQANAYAQGATGISGAVGGGLQNYMLMNALNKGGFGTGGTSLFGGGNTALSMASPSATTMAGGTVGALIPGAY